MASSDWIGASEILFSAVEFESGEISVAFNPKAFWDKNHHLIDDHVLEIFDEMKILYPDYLDEVAENCCMVFAESGETPSLDEVIQDLTAKGFIHSKAMDSYLTKQLEY